MARDYASKSRAGRRRRPSLPGWAWLAAGVVIGLFAAFLAYLSHVPRTEQAFDARELLPAPKTTDTREVRAQSEPAAPPAPPKPRFDFYTILPELEVAIPEHELERERSQGGTPAEPDASYVLQVGSFQRHDEAESLKASLALNHGLQATIQTVTINDQPWHRVRLGPYHSLRELGRIRNRLLKDDIDAILLKIRG